METEPIPDQVTNKVVAAQVSQVVQCGAVAGDIHLHGMSHPLVPRQLPLPNPWFAGRAGELAALTAAADAGHVAVVGQGGVGKTNLVLHWAHGNTDRFPDGQLFVDLRDRHISEVLLLLLDGLEGGHPVVPESLDAKVGRYRSLLAGRRVLIVFDDAPSSADLARLLPGAGASTALITSRHLLDGLYSSAGVHRLKVDPMPDPEAVAVLTRRIGAARAAREPAALSELVAYCAGLPLALAVVAGRLATHPSFPVAAVAAELRDASMRLAALETGERSMTLSSVLSSSYDQLDPRTRTLLSYMSTAGLPDFGVPALAALADTELAVVNRCVRELEHASLADEHLPGRWRLHDLVRLHVAAQNNDTEQPMLRLVDHYLHTALRGDRHLDGSRVVLAIDSPFPGSHPREIEGYQAAMAWFDVEHQCISAVQRLAAERGWHTRVWQLSWAAHSYRWRTARAHDQVISWRLALEAAEHIGEPRMTAVAHRLFGAASARTGSLDDALTHLGRALRMFADLGDLVGQADAQRALARAYECLDRYGAALERAESALRCYRKARLASGEADALDLVCWYEAKLGRLDDAYTHGTEALLLYQRLENKDGEATVLDSLGHVAHLRGDRSDAVQHYEKALALLDGRNSYHQANTLDRLGEVNVELGEPGNARVAWERALELFHAQRRDSDADRLRRLLDGLGDS